MAEESVRQKVAAILAADAVGYTRLMADDETATIDALDAARAVFVEHVEANQGRIVDTAGDSVLAVFETTAGAVQAAVAIQDRLAEINEPVPEERRMRFRIGIHLGDIHEKADGSIYGDGVNVAARLEGLADPGAIIVSDSVQAALRGRLDVDFADSGAHEVKNVAEPVRAFRILRPGEEPETRQTRARWLMPAVGAAIAAATIAAAGIWLWLGKEVAPQMVAADGQPTDDPVLAVPTGPSIAVLPFDNLSNDPEQNYFAEGLAADISRYLSAQPEFFVLGRGTTSHYRDLEVREIGSDLGVNYVIQGSVRRGGDTIRVSATLVDANTGGELWSKVYDREIGTEDFFAVQDDITSNIAITIGDAYGIIAQRTDVMASEREVTKLSSFECVLLAYRYFEILTPGDHMRARDCLEATVLEEPDYAEAWGWLAILYSHEVAVGYNMRDGSLDRALEAGLRATEVGPNSQMAWEGLAAAHFFRHEFHEFDLAANKALLINPNDAATVANIGHYYGRWGVFDKSLPLMRKAMALSPYHPFWYYIPFYLSGLDDGDYSSALEYARKAHIPGMWWSHEFLIPPLAFLGEDEKAQREAQEVLRLFPEFPNIFWFSHSNWNLPVHLQEMMADGLRKSGVELPPNPAEAGEM